ncbi:YlxR family protein [Candidatus Mycoplasma pogonae]
MKTEIKTSPKVITRKCIVTNEIKPTTQMLRFVRLANGAIHFDVEHQILGRGAYVTNELQVLEKLFQKKLLNRAFKQKIDHEVYLELKEEVYKWLKTKVENEM